MKIADTRQSTQVCVISVLILFTLSRASIEGAEITPPRVRASEILASNNLLAELLIAYAVYLRNADDFTPAHNDANGRTGVLRRFRKLESNIERMKCGINLSLTQTHNIFVLNSHIRGQQVGVPPSFYENAVYVFFNSQNSGILVVLSDVSPVRTRIISVNTNLDTQLLYDSFTRNVLRNQESILSDRMLGYVFEIRVDDTNAYSLLDSVKVIDGQLGNTRAFTLRRKGSDISLSLERSD